MLRKLEFDTIYYAYFNESPFKYYISILGGVRGLRPRLFCLFRGGPGFGKTYYIILARSPRCRKESLQNLDGENMKYLASLPYIFSY